MVQTFTKATAHRCIVNTLNFYIKTINRCDLFNRVYQVKSDCRKQTDEIMKKKIKECVKKYQDRTWWDKL